MIYPETKIFVVDNCGAKIVKCIQILKSSKRRGGYPGQIIIGSIRKLKFGKRVYKGDLIRGVFIRGKKYITRSDGTRVSFNQNAMVSVNEKGLPLGTRLFGPIYKELRETQNVKLISLAKFIV